MRIDTTFQSEGEAISAFLYTPDHVEPPYPVVVMAGGWCYVKELIQPHYARSFVERGFAVLLFDYRRFGGSGGQPRQHLAPWDQIEDYKNAVSYVSTLPEIDNRRVAAWGISYSGGHVLILGATDPRLSCVVSNIPVVDGWDNMRRAHGTMGFRKLLAAIAEDREKRFQTGEHGYIPMSGVDYGETVVTWPFPETYRVFMDLKESEAPAHEHRNTVASVENLLNYNVFPYMERILDTPTMMIVAENDDLTLWDREIEAFNAIPTAKKELLVIADTSHMTLYSDKSRLEIAAEAAADWFEKHLIPPTA